MKASNPKTTPTAAPPPFYPPDVAAARRFYLDMKPARDRRLTVISGGLEHYTAGYAIRRDTFLINPPAALYYTQGLNTTPVHAHAVLFGVYGMLGIGLMLFCLRDLTRQEHWKTRLLSFSFWSLNVGLVLMIGLSLLSVGLLQTWASVEHGMWYARAAEFLQKPLLQNLRWLRMVGDTIFAVGALGIGWFVLGLKTGWSFADESEESVALAAAAKKSGVKSQIQLGRSRN